MATKSINKSVIEKEPQKKKKTARRRKWVSTKIVRDIFADNEEVFKPHSHISDLDLLERLWAVNPEITTILRKAPDVKHAREGLFTYLEKIERHVFDTDNDLHILEKATVREAVRVFKSIIGPINEKRVKFSALKVLWKLANGKPLDLGVEISPGFIMEFINLFLALAGRSYIYQENGGIKKSVPDFLKIHGRAAAEERSKILDSLGNTVREHFKKYPSGLEEEVIRRRLENKQRILSYFNASEEDWNDYMWHLKHVIRDPSPLLDLLELPQEQLDAIEKAIHNKIPFGITPYYLSLMDHDSSLGYDHAIRAQVIPPKDYVDLMVMHKEDRAYVFDFMGEHDTSPVPLVTRRYPLITIIKPFNTCAQICVYCQRNWEIDSVLDPRAMASRKKLEDALSWLDSHPTIGDVLITGGDPLIMKDHHLEHILESLSKKDQVYRIRLGTRTPVVLPQRWTDKLTDMIASFHEPGKREIAVVTHFEHSYEITPEAVESVQKIRKKGIGVYNQAVFTIENSRRFELAKLRVDLRKIGVDPYYTFNMKGKEETKRYMVPIARLLQERKEEARLLPGLDRTDEPVFNVPKLGKNHLRAWQDHRVIMILPNGSRVYEFHPWEKYIEPVPPYNYVDVPIYDYLEELASRGEDIKAYRTIWYYY